MSHREGNSKQFDKRWRKNRVRNKIAKVSKRKNRKRL